MPPEIMYALIPGFITLGGILLTTVYSFFRDRIQNRRLAAELYNQRELMIFEARLDSYREIFAVLMLLETRAIPKLTPNKAIKIEKQLKEAFYIKTSHSMSAESIEYTAILRDSLISYSQGTLEAEKLKDIRFNLMSSLHKDLGRTGWYIGSNKPLMEEDTKNIDNLLSRNNRHKSK